MQTYNFENRPGVLRTTYIQWYATEERVLVQLSRCLSQPFQIKQLAYRHTPPSEQPLVEQNYRAYKGRNLESHHVAHDSRKFPFPDPLQGRLLRLDARRQQAVRARVVVLGVLGSSSSLVVKLNRMGRISPGLVVTFCAAKMASRS